MSSKHIGILLVSALAGGLASCSEADSGGTCANAGVAGCPCIQGGLCVQGLVCYEGLCLPPGGGEAEDPGETGLDGGDDGKPIPDMGANGDTGPAPGSCEGACGGEGSGDCWCDPSCIGLGDCCEDYADACPGACLSNADCAADEVCSASSQTCEKAYGWTYDVWVSHWADFADVCWDADSCTTPDPFYKIVLGGQTVFTSSVVDDTGIASWSTPASLVIDGAATLFIRMSDEDISFHDWILDWGELNAQGVFTAPSLATLHAGYVLEECWAAPYAAGNGCYELEIRFVAQ